MNPRGMKRNLIRSIRLIKSIHNRLERNSLLQANTPLLLALSGGQDSMTMVSFFLQIKNQRRYKVGWCWCNHLWRYDVFHTMHHLMRLAFTVGEPISFLIEPTTEPSPEGGRKYIEKGDGPPFRTLAIDLPFCERKERGSSLFDKKRERSFSTPPQKREVKGFLISPSASASASAKQMQKLSTKGEKRETFFSRQPGGPFFPHSRRLLLRRWGGWIAEKSKRSKDDFSTSSASSVVKPKKTSFSYAEAIELTKTKGHGEKKQGKWSFTEAGARRSRYQSCHRLATFHRFRILQVGHTASDRIETGVFHLLRGSGMRGVAGIQRSRIFRKLYPKHFSFSNFYAIDIEKFEANQERFQYHKKGVDLPLQKRVQPSFYQESCQRNISFEKQKVTTCLNKKEVRSPRLTRLMRTARCTVKGLRNHLPYGGRKIQFFYSYFLERKKETLPLTSSKRDEPLYPTLSDRDDSCSRAKEPIVDGIDDWSREASFARPLPLTSSKGDEPLYPTLSDRDDSCSRAKNPIVEGSTIGLASHCFARPLYPGPKVKKSDRDEPLLLHRPLLSVSRSDVRRVCYLWQLPVYPDASNQTFQYARNRIRNQLLPTLRFQFNRQVDGTLFHFTTLLSTEQLYLDSLSQRLFPSICVVARNYIAFHVAGLNPFPAVIRRQILKQTLEKYATQSLHLSHIDTLCRVLEKKRPKGQQFFETSCLFLFSRRMRPENLFEKRTAREVEQDSKATNLFEDELVSFFFPCPSSVKRAEGSARTEINRRVIDDKVIFSQQSGTKKVSPLPGGGSWKDCFTMPTHRFLPTIGSFLFLGKR